MKYTKMLIVLLIIACGGSSETSKTMMDKGLGKFQTTSDEESLRKAIMDTMYYAPNVDLCNYDNPWDFFYIYRPSVYPVITKILTNEATLWDSLRILSRKREDHVISDVNLGNFQKWLNDLQEVTATDEQIESLAHISPEYKRCFLALRKGIDSKDDILTHLEMAKWLEDHYDENINEFYNQLVAKNEQAPFFLEVQEEMSRHLSNTPSIVLASFREFVATVGQKNSKVPHLTNYTILSQLDYTLETDAYLFNLTSDDLRRLKRELNSLIMSNFYIDSASKSSEDLDVRIRGRSGVIIDIVDNMIKGHKINIKDRRKFHDLIKRIPVGIVMANLLHLQFDSNVDLNKELNTYFEKVD